MQAVVHDELVFSSQHAKNELMAISILMNFIKFSENIYIDPESQRLVLPWSVATVATLSKVDESSLNIKQSVHIVSSYFQNTKIPQANQGNISHCSVESLPVDNSYPISSQVCVDYLEPCFQLLLVSFNLGFVEPSELKVDSYRLG